MHEALGLIPSTVKMPYISLEKEIEWDILYFKIHLECYLFISSYVSEQANYK
jgi:hypothetical protein